MTFLHECGHILCGCASGGTLTAADLLPWHLPYSLFQPDPHPLVTLWGGPLLGVLVPSVFALAIGTKWAWFIAHFCTLANGSYIAAAWVSGDRYLDTIKLLEHGAHPVWIAAYCLVTITCGYIGFRRQCVLILSPGSGQPSTGQPSTGQPSTGQPSTGQPSTDYRSLWCRAWQLKSSQKVDYHNSDATQEHH